MLNEWKQQVEEVITTNNELSEELKRLKHDLDEKTVFCNKIKGLISIAEKDSHHMITLLQSMTGLIKQLRTSTDDDREDLLNELEWITRDIEQEALAVILTKSNPRKRQPIKQATQNENDRNGCNLRKRNNNNRIKVEVDEVSSELNTSSDYGEDKKATTIRRKKQKLLSPSDTTKDQANNLINEIFNF